MLSLISFSNRKDYTHSKHSQRVSKYAVLLAEALGIEDRDYLHGLEQGALLHDIGKACIPASILLKPHKLNPYERALIMEHPLFGYDLISEFDLLKRASRIVLYHHENYDGTGYPYGLKGKDIPLEARVFAIADTLDAITSHRPYRRARSFKMAFEEIKKGSGTQFDPVIIDAFFSITPELWQEIKQDMPYYSYLQTVHFVLNPPITRISWNIQ